ncbi:MAG: RNA polymerase sigma factor [Candidatus Hydrogenedentes bacterium]|nr:RNA polymerase sigma factor [Candidatus Hydrogenedentota bacterium]
MTQGGPERDVRWNEDAGDAALACAVQTGEGHAFDVLAERYAARIYQHLYRIVGHRQEAEDLTQESFLKAFRAIQQYDASREFRSWLYAIATNTGRNALRARGRRGPMVSLDGEENFVPAGTENDTSDAQLRADRQAQLAEAMGRLPEHAAALVDLHYREGMSLREAAAVLGTTEGAAKVALHRARRQLRAWLIRDE